MKDEICVMRMGGLGDVTILSSSLSALKEKIPHRPLVFATMPHNVPVLMGAEYLERIITIEEAERQPWFKVFDCRWGVEPPNIGPGKTTWHDYTSTDRSDIFDRLLGVQSKKEFSIAVDKKAAAQVQALLSGLKRPLVGIAPTSRSPIRCIPPEFVHPMSSLVTQTMKARVVLFGKTEPWSKPLAAISGDKILNLIDLLDVKEMVALVNSLDYIISPDTATYHVAAALKKPCLAIFGNIEPHTRTTYYTTVKAVFPYGELPCIPCWDVPHVCHRVPNMFGAPCMRLFTPQRIIEELRDMI